VIELVRLEQSRTYYGVLAGKRFPGAAQNLIADALTRAREVSLEDVAPLLLAQPDGLELPEVRTIASFDSGSLQRAGSEPYSSLVVVWFQEGFGLEVGEKVLAQLGEVEWEGLAGDWCW
jgi:hypothetical protein